MCLQWQMWITHLQRLLCQRSEEKVLKHSLFNFQRESIVGQIAEFGSFQESKKPEFREIHPSSKMQSFLCFIVPLNSRFRFEDSKGNFTVFSTDINFFTSFRHFKNPFVLSLASSPLSHKLRSLSQAIAAKLKLMEGQAVQGEAPLSTPPLEAVV